MDQRLAKAIGKELKNQLLTGNTVSVNGLGTFSVVHQQQNQQQDQTGRVMLMPPADKIKFTPE